MLLDYSCSIRNRSIAWAASRSILLSSISALLISISRSARLSSRSLSLLVYHPALLSSPLSPALSDVQHSTQGCTSMPARLEVYHTDIWTPRQQINIASNSGQLEINHSTRAQIIWRTPLEYNAKRPSHRYLLSAVISIRKRISYIAQQSSNVSATWPMSRDPYSFTVNRRDHKTGPATRRAHHMTLKWLAVTPVIHRSRVMHWN